MNFSEPILLWYERRRNIFNRAAQSSLEQSQSTKQLLCHTLVSQPSATVAISDSFSRVGEAAAVLSNCPCLLATGQVVNIAPGPSQIKTLLRNCAAMLSLVSVVFFCKYQFKPLLKFLCVHQLKIKCTFNSIFTNQPQVINIVDTSR